MQNDTIMSKVEAIEFKKSILLNIFNIWNSGRLIWDFASEVVNGVENLFFFRKITISLPLLLAILTYIGGKDYLK